MIMMMRPADKYRSIFESGRMAVLVERWGWAMMVTKVDDYIALALQELAKESQMRAQEAKTALDEHVALFRKMDEEARQRGRAPGHPLPMTPSPEAYSVPDKDAHEWHEARQSAMGFVPEPEPQPQFSAVAVGSGWRFVPEPEPEQKSSAAPPFVPQGVKSSAAPPEQKSNAPFHIVDEEPASITVGFFWTPPRPDPSPP